MQANFKAKILLDTSALVALIRKEPGYEIIDNILGISAISSVNLSELIAVLSRYGVLDEDIDEIISDKLVPEIIPFCENIGIKAGRLFKLTKDYGLSLGDRACLATAQHYKMEVYTADKVWKELQHTVSSHIKIIR